jgi:hypothetical protein
VEPLPKAQALSSTPRTHQKQTTKKENPPSVNEGSRRWHMKTSLHSKGGESVDVNTEKYQVSKCEPGV